MLRQPVSGARQLYHCLRSSAFGRITFVPVLIIECQVLGAAKGWKPLIPQFTWKTQKDWVFAPT